MKKIILIAALGIVGVWFAIGPKAEAQILELDAIVVEGRIQRPQASYILQRATLDFGIQAKRRSFVGKIVKTIETEPF